MADTDLKKRVARAEKLLETVFELYAKQGACLRELKELLVGGETVGDQMRQLTAHYVTTWEARYGSRYAWQGGKDSAAAKRLVQTLPMEELKSRVDRYLKDDDPFYMKARHPFTLFASNVNRYAPEKAAPLQLSPVVDGCNHQPPCQSDVEHTRRRQDDRRAQQAH